MAVSRAAPTADENYLFDLHGFLHLKSALSADEVRDLNAALDEHPTTRNSPSMQNPEKLPLHPRSDFLFWHQGFRDLLDHPRIVPYLEAWVGPAVRLDHCYGVFSQPGERQLPMHHGGTPFREFAFYQARDGRIFNSLVVVSWALVSLPTGGGTFTCIPGSHKAAFRPPPGVMDFSEDADYVHEIAMEPGDAVIFSEALTHGARPWRMPYQRRTLLYKYAAAGMAWSNESWPTALLDELTGDQARLLRGPYMHDVHEKDHGFRRATFDRDDVPLLRDA